MQIYQIVLLVVGLGLALAYLLGPKPPVPEYPMELPVVPTAPGELETYLQKREADESLREDNQARIVWQNSGRQQTEYSIVYLHGFAGSYRDGYPVNVQTAEKYGANIFLARWAGHGKTKAAAMNDMSPENAWKDAREALAIGLTIGRKVIIMSTSTGGTLAIKLAAEFPDRVHALVNMGPNMKDDQMGTFVLNTRWGYEIAKLVTLDGDKEIEHKEPQADQYFDTFYPSEALVELQVLVGTTMVDEVFSRVSCPVLTTYYHEHNWNEDEHVEIEIYPRVHETFATPESQRSLVALPDAKTHFVGSDIKSKDVASTQRVIDDFLQEIVGLTVN